MGRVRIVIAGLAALSAAGCAGPTTNAYDGSWHGSGDGPGKCGAGATTSFAVTNGQILGEVVTPLSDVPEVFSGWVSPDGKAGMYTAPQEEDVAYRRRIDIVFKGATFEMRGNLACYGEPILVGARTSVASR